MGKNLENRTVEENLNDRTFKARQEALFERDAVTYARLCDQEGVKPEDPFLYEQGWLELQQQNQIYFDLEQRTKELEYWAKVARVALPRFPELERGGSISVKEIKRRLREIREAGYPVQPYSEMRKEEAWNYLMQIRKEVYRKAEQYCPEVLSEIKERNARQKREAREIR